MRLVVDASIGGAWCLSDEESNLALEVLDRIVEAQLIVPAHWSLELSNLLVVAERRSRIDAEAVRNATRFLRSLPFTVDVMTTGQALSATLELARRHQLTSYDAAYLELAIREGAVLATLDQRLTRVASSEGVRVFGHTT
ncbi:MAG: type II toxin-antitoxin system VapC family toxin [Methanoregulaceae archaeon]|nr:type II toxin-antitoxin system VapC family toxin [Methanoregulaceae archaeon]